MKRRTQAQLEREYKKYQCERCYRLQLELDKYKDKNNSKDNDKDNDKNNSTTHNKHSAIIDFFTNKGTDQSGRTIEDVWSFSYKELESNCDYIQWLFPTTEKSIHNLDAPVLTRDDINELSKPKHQKTLLKSLKMMLDFYGFVRLPLNGAVHIGIGTTTTFARRSKVWLTQYNHNFKRFSRIIKSLKELGMHNDAKALYYCLTEEVGQEYKDIITPDLIKHWKKALGTRTRTSAVVDFYSKKGTDQYGRTMDDLWSHGFENFDDNNYIEWLFPTTPVLTREDIKELSKPHHQQTLLLNFIFTLEMYGLKRLTVSKHSSVIVKNNEKRMKKWNGDTFKTFTRMMKSMKELGMGHESKALYDCLTQDDLKKDFTVPAHVKKQWKKVMSQS